MNLKSTISVSTKHDKWQIRTYYHSSEPEQISTFPINISQAIPTEETLFSTTSRNLLDTHDDEKYCIVHHE